MGILQRLRHTLWSLRDEAKWAADWNTLVGVRRRRPGRQQLTVRLHGRRVEVWVRGDTIDVDLARQILREDSEYTLPVPLRPRVILDIGGNIGCTSLYYASKYPDARIWTFEPLPDNLELLRLNTAQFGSRITVVPVGLGRVQGTLAYYPSNDRRNYGGGGFETVGVNLGEAIRLPVTTLALACQQYEIPQPDLIKLDTEGGELSVLEGAPPELIANAQAIIGELHGISDWDVLSRLSAHHQIACTKALAQRCFPFVAVKPAATLHG
jgi:FkbM family methyltransferase